MTTNDDREDEPPPHAVAADDGVFRYDWTARDGVTTGVATAVASVTGSEVTEMVPLAHAVDTDALEALVSGAPSDEPVSISFVYEGVDVRVTSDGAIAVCPAPANG